MSSLRGESLFAIYNPLDVSPIDFLSFLFFFMPNMLEAYLSGTDSKGWDT